jgi:hypothetical protein
MAGNNHGALGSNQKLERIHFEPQPQPAAEEESSEELSEEAPVKADTDEVPTSSAIKSKDDGDVVYLREDLRPGRY